MLAATRELYPLARRVLLTAYSDIEAAVKAINEAHIDHYLSKPWDPPEERLFPVVDDLLDSWQAEYLPEAKGLRLVGHQWSPRSHAIKDFLASSLIPYRWLDVERDPDARTLIEAAGVGVDELPVLFFEDGSVLRDPDPRSVAERLGRSLSAAFDVYDLVIVGAGPAGLAAAVYGASEGLRTLMLDRHAPGGQAGSSSRIENYLGFPAGRQRQRADPPRADAGAASRRRVPRTARSRPACRSTAATSVSRFPTDAQLVTRTMLAATGMMYREHPAPGIAEHTGAGVYYGAATTEAPAFKGRRVLVIGGGNSAGQGAMYLARYAKTCRSSCAARTCAAACRNTSLIRSPRPRTSASGRERSSNALKATVTSNESRSSRCDGTCRVEEADALFIFIGTRPRSEWLPAEVLRDDKGFVLTGRDLIAAEGFTRVWKERREPLTLESSVPGLFAAGDVRAGAMNRVASAVGEGSMVVRLAHEYLALS